MDLQQQFFEQWKSRQKVPRLIAIPSSAFPSAVKRPPYSVLSNEKLNKIFGVKLPHWEESLLLL